MLFALKSLIHIPPRLFRRSEGFTSLSYCPKCNILASTADVPATKPCPKCGEKLYDKLNGRWEQISQGWFKPHRGEWRLTSASKEVVEHLYSEHRIPTPAVLDYGIYDADPTSLDFTGGIEFTDNDLDFTKE